MTTGIFYLTLMHPFLLSRYSCLLSLPLLPLSASLFLFGIAPLACACALVCAGGAGGGGGGQSSETTFGSASPGLLSPRLVSFSLVAGETVDATLR